MLLSILGFSPANTRVWLSYTWFPTAHLNVETAVCLPAHAPYIAHLCIWTQTSPRCSFRQLLELCRMPVRTGRTVSPVFSCLMSLLRAVLIGFTVSLLSWKMCRPYVNTGIIPFSPWTCTKQPECCSFWILNIELDLNCWTTRSIYRDPQVLDDGFYRDEAGTRMGRHRVQWLRCWFSLAGAHTSFPDWIAVPLDLLPWGRYHQHM